MQCKEVLVHLWEYLDEELTREEAEAIAAHLRHCRECFPAYSCNRAFLELLARQRTACSAPTALLTLVRAHLRIA